MADLAFSPSASHIIRTLDTEGVIAGHGLVVSPDLHGNQLIAQFIEQSLITRLSVREIGLISPGIVVYCFGVDPWPEGTLWYFRFLSSRFPSEDPYPLNWRLGHLLAVDVVPPQADMPTLHTQPHSAV
jgi:hypothetical protein